MECGDWVILIDEDNVEQFTPYILLSKETLVAIGSSGAGKSTLINYIFDTKVQKTLEIGENDKGKHTTTTRKLFLTESGHYLMDNPGIRALVLMVMIQALKCLIDSQIVLIQTSLGAYESC